MEKISTRIKTIVITGDDILNSNIKLLSLVGDITSSKDNNEKYISISESNKDCIISYLKMIIESDLQNTKNKLLLDLAISSKCVREES